MALNTSLVSPFTMHHIEHSTAAIQAAWAWGVAGVSAIGGVAHRYLGQSSTAPGTVKLIDAGFAGLFILALIWANIMQWRQRIADATIAQAAIEKRDEKLDQLEKEVRESLLADLRQANSARHQMIDLMKRQEGRDLSP